MDIFKFRNLITGQATPIPPGEFSVGRADDAYVHVEDISVSRRHALVINQEDGFFVEDLGSANGTATHGALVNGRVRVEFGDVVHVGMVPFRVDPEVSAGAVAEPSAGLRAARPNVISRDTEKIPLSETVLQRMETPAAAQFPAPEPPPADVPVEAAEPRTLPVRKQADLTPARLPIIRPGMGGVPEGMPEPSAVLAPRPQSGSLPKPATHKIIPPPAQYPPPEPAMPRRENLTPTPASAARAPTAQAPAPATSGTNWGWLVMTFLAGVAVGLLLGLYFAKLFLDLGGKGISLH